MNFSDLDNKPNEVEIAQNRVVASLKIDDNHATIGVSVSQARHVVIKLLYSGDTIFERTVSLTPENAFVETTVVTYTHALLRRMGHSGRAILYDPDVTLQIFDVQNGKKLVEIIPANV